MKRAENVTLEPSSPTGALASHGSMQYYDNNAKL
jgi:hypothetical protein